MDKENFYCAWIDFLRRRFLEFGLDLESHNDADDAVAIAELHQNKILVNTSVRSQQEIVFTLAHLFGHYIQFGNFEKYKHLILKVREEPKPLALDQAFKEGFYNYELVAFQIGKALLEEFVPFDLEVERKYQIFFETDFDIFWHYLTTGENVMPKQFNDILYMRYEADRTQRLPMQALPFGTARVDNHGISLNIY